MTYRCWCYHTLFAHHVRRHLGQTANFCLTKRILSALPLRTLQLQLQLPEGREETIAAKLGQTVQYTKAVLHERFDVPIDKQV